ncbi:CheW protein [Pseudomonas sp. SLBN-26]|uniref:Chemotaxis protein CheW n=1 Tax=Metapseudomonas otitidis TaxID=319939 RepID=A0A679GNA9_9GAMM|nr:MULTISPECIES: chemotaxis protein CheW [Pseudomonas]KIV72352.1 Positive regulator of CheA protein activity (CheW) [Pseudomonas sp. FeS53a]MCP1616268.1 purine-binding chemotaxis protein CheW [Pseudomonas otitidis]MDI6528578.1 chemotaxis protein CheW [Pseudomonas otitidis]TQL05525.1 CheW protein [Pseudomonas sp. SLBN-26]BCA29009.1 chemotaxis protein CheW [Pseudomonas otitidis]
MSTASLPLPEFVDDEQRQYLTFRVGRDLFGVATRYVREILEFHAITQVPMMPPLVRGVINLRGAVVPIIDLAERFGLGSTELGPRTCIVIIELQDGEEAQLMGALVDAVTAVAEIEPPALRQAPAFGSRVPPEYIEDLARVDERFLTLLRMEQVLNVDQIAALAGQRNTPRLSLV